MDWCFTAQNATGNLDSTIRDHFVGIHVRLRAATGLPDAQGKVIVQLADNYFIGSLFDEPQLVAREFPKFMIDDCGGFFENAQGADHFARHAIVADSEMDQAALGLRAPILVRGHFNLAHGIGFETTAGLLFWLFLRHTGCLNLRLDRKDIVHRRHNSTETKLKLAAPKRLRSRGARMSIWWFRIFRCRKWMGINYCKSCASCR